MASSDDIIKQRLLKSFIKVGLTFIDIKLTIGFSFIDNPEGYIIVQFVYDSGRALNAFINNRNEFSQFLLEIEPFIDDDISMQSITSIMDEVERAVKPNIQNNTLFMMNKPKKRRRNNRIDGDDLENEN